MRHSSVTGHFSIWPGRIWNLLLHHGPASVVGELKSLCCAWTKKQWKTVMISPASLKTQRQVLCLGQVDAEWVADEWISLSHQSSRSHIFEAGTEKWCHLSGKEHWTLLYLFEREAALSTSWRWCKLGRGQTILQREETSLRAIAVPALLASSQKAKSSYCKEAGCLGQRRYQWIISWKEENL